MKNLNKILSNIKPYYGFIIISIIMVVSSLLLPKVGFLPMGQEGFDILNNILFPLSHANVFHLGCNLLCLFQMRKPYYLAPAVIISFLCSFMPCPVIDFAEGFVFVPIMGFSGVLFAIIGIKWGRIAGWKQMWSRIWLFFFITAFIPNVAFLFHLYCIVFGYLYGYINSSILLWQKARTCL